MKTTAGGVVIWASELDAATLEQARRTARSPAVWGHVALMPDAHLGSGATIGSVIATKDAIIPAAVGADLGCGVEAAKTSLNIDDLVTGPSMDALHNAIKFAIPAGTGRDHRFTKDAARKWLIDHPMGHTFGEQSERDAMNALAGRQLGTLGSGNHFVELSTDPQGAVWAVLHSGSRGVGHKLASYHIKVAQTQCNLAGVELEDKALAHLTHGTRQFYHYLRDVLWAQDYARANREFMMCALLAALRDYAGAFDVVERISCHHNYIAAERHFGQSLWITRKGAIDAHKGVMGIVPGSMATATYIVKGKGEPDSYCSSAHGAGRRFSRKMARKTFSEESLNTYMADKTWNRDAVALLDEHPEAYKDIEQVMSDMSDLVEPVTVLKQFLNYKGVS